MAKEPPPFTWTGWGLTQAADCATAASTYLQNLSQAKDLQERALAHAKFVKMRIEKYDERAKELSDALAAANNFLGCFVLLIQRLIDLDKMERRNSSPDTKTDGNGRERRSSAKRSVRQSAARPTNQRATIRGGSKSRVKRRRR